MTTNALAETRRAAPGFTGAERIADPVSAFKGTFAPELVNRIDAICAFRPLGREHAATILRDVLLPRWQRAHPDVNLSVTDGAISYCADAGYSAALGARELERTLERELLLPVAQALLAGTPRALVVDVSDGRVVVAASSRD